MRVPDILRTASPRANALTAASLALLVVKILFLNRFTAFAFGLYELGLVLEAVLASVVASYVFYLFVVHLKETEDKATLAPYVSKHTNRVVGACESQLAEIAKATGIPLELATVSEEALSQAFSKIAPYSDAPLILAPANAYANWPQYFEFHIRTSREGIGRVFAQIIYLDAAHVRLLTEVDDCTHFTFVPQLQNIKLSSANLSSLASMFYRYTQAVLKLKQYMHSEFRASAL